MATRSRFHSEEAGSCNQPEAVLAGCVRSGSDTGAERDDATAEVAEALASGANLIWVNSIGTAETPLKLRSLAGGSHPKAAVTVALGFWRSGDGGGGIFYWDATSTLPDDGGTVIQVTGLATGRWKRVYDGVLNVKFFGAKGAGTEDTAAILTAIAAVPATGGTLFFPPGSYVVSSTLKISVSSTHIRGSGIYSTLINFIPPTGATWAGAACFCFSRPAPSTGDTLANCSITGIAFYSPDTTHQKIAITTANVSNLKIEDIATGCWGGGGGGNAPTTPSIGLWLRGRETITVRNVVLYADRPVHIDQNPWTAASIDADHYHFQDLTLASFPSKAEPCINFENTTQLAGHGPAVLFVTNFTIDGANAFIPGTDGIRFVDPQTNTAGGSCQNLHIQNIRMEQTNSAAGSFGVRLSLVNRGFYNVNLTNVAADACAQGFFFRNVRVLTLENCAYAGTGVAFDSDGILDGAGHTNQGCMDITLLNTFFQEGSTINSSNLVESFSLSRYNTRLPPCLHYDTVANPNVRGVTAEKIHLGASSGTGPTFTTGAGVPSVDEPVGSLYLNLSGGASSTLYVKTAVGTSGWTSK